jgi:hypothetical protein
MNTQINKGLVNNSNSLDSNSNPSIRLLSSNLSQLIDGQKTKYIEKKIESETNKSMINDQSISNFK